MAGIDSLGKGVLRSVSVGTKSPFLAVLLAFIPGLGAVYNGLIIRALAQFSVVAGLWQFAHIVDASLFTFAGFLFYGYSLIDAYQVARRINAGQDLSLEEDKLRNFIRRNTALWGSGLIALGVLSFLSWLWPSVFSGNIWPVLFVLAGAVILFFSRNQRPSETKIQSFDPELLSFDPVAHDYTRAETRRLDAR